MANRILQYRDGSGIGGGTVLQDLAIIGVDGLIIESPGDLMTDIFGLSTCTTVYKLPIDRGFIHGTFDEGAIPSLLSSHPLYPALHMERRRVAMEQGNYSITAEYAGVMTQSGSSVHVYELCIGVADEPIETHIDFVSAIGGKPSNPLHGAVFLGPDGQVTTDDQIGQFAYFNHMTEFAGIESYLAADQVTWRERYVQNAIPGGNPVGRINAPPGPAPSAVNWLHISRSYEQRGLSYFVTDEWRASGRRGWNSTIYG